MVSENHKPLKRRGTSQTEAAPRHKPTGGSRHRVTSCIRRGGLGRDVRGVRERCERGVRGVRSERGVRGVREGFERGSRGV